MSDKPSTVSTALSYAAEGWRVFPISPGSKFPFEGTHGHLEATTDADQIATWFGVDHTDANIGAATGSESGRWVLDVDMQEPGVPAAHERLLESIPELRDTRTHQTPRGGFHYILEYPEGAGEWKNSGAKAIRDLVGLAGKGIDVRGEGGYILAPGSTVGGKGYEVVNDAPVRAMPKKLRKLTKEREFEAPVVTDTDGRAYASLAAHEKRRADQWLGTLKRGELQRLRDMKDTATLNPADYRGPAWDNTCFEVAVRLFEVALQPWTPYSSDRVYADFFAHAPLDEGFTRNDHRRILESASNKALKDRTVIPLPAVDEPLYELPIDDDESDLEDDFAGRDEAWFALDEITRARVDQLDREDMARAYRQQRERASRLSFADRTLRRLALATVPPVEPLIEGILPRGAQAALVGPSGVGKSALALALAVHVAAGKPVLGHDTIQQRVLYIAAEGQAGIPQRINAIEQAWSVTAPDEGFLVHPEPVDLGNETAVAEAADFITEHQIGLLVVDTLNASAGDLEENSATAMGRVMASLKRLVAGSPGATVLTIHHTGHNGKMRGSTAIFAAMDTVLMLDGDPSALTLRLDKSKDGPTGTVGLYKLTPSNGSVIVEGRVAGNDTQEVTATRRDKALALFRAKFSAIGASKAEWRDLLLAEGISRTYAYEAINDVTKSGAVLQDGNQFTLALPSSK